MPAPRRAIQWCGLALLAAIALTWFASRWWGFYWCGTNGTATYRVELASGRLRLALDSYPNVLKKAWVSGHALAPTSPDATRLWLWWFNGTRLPPRSLAQVYIPIWALPVLLALPIAFLTHRRRRRALRLARTNACPHCLYSLTGLAPNSPCPECGKPARMSHA